MEELGFCPKRLVGVSEKKRHKNQLGWLKTHFWLCKLLNVSFLDQCSFTTFDYHIWIHENLYMGYHWQQTSCQSNEDKIGADAEWQSD